MPLSSPLTKVHPLSSLTVFSEVIHAAPEPTPSKTLHVLMHMQGSCIWRIKVLTGDVKSDISSPLEP